MARFENPPLSSQRSKCEISTEQRRDTELNGATRCVTIWFVPPLRRSIRRREWNRVQQFFICSCGFFFGYLVNGVCEGFVYLALIHLHGFTVEEMVNPWRTSLKLSVVLMGSHGLTKGSLAFLSYPAQLMFKSTKVLPVMVMSPRASHVHRPLV